MYVRFAPTFLEKKMIEKYCLQASNRDIMPADQKLDDPGSSSNNTGTGLMLANMDAL